MLCVVARTCRLVSLSLALLLPAAFAACQKGGSDQDSAAVDTDTGGGLTDGNTAISPNAATSGNAQSGLAGSSNSNIKPIAWPTLSFVNNPGGKDAKAVALSFDDAPDGTNANPWGKASPSNMSHMLDQLDALKLKATFFLCANRWCDAKNDTQAQADIQRMLAAGHAIGSHTYDHPDLVPDTARNRAAIQSGTLKMPILTADAIKAEFTQNDAAFADAKLIGPSRTPFTMWRAPFGYPFQDGIVYPADNNSIVDDVSGVAPYTSYNAVHVGWGIDSRDWECVQTMANTQSQARVDCIVKNVKAFLDKGASGVILMHAVYKESGDALPQIVQLIQDHNMKIVQVEDLIKDKYGVNSADIYKANVANPTPFDAAAINQAAVQDSKISKWFLGTNEG